MLPARKARLPRNGGLGPFLRLSQARPLRFPTRDLRMSSSMTGPQDARPTLLEAHAREQARHVSSSPNRSPLPLLREQSFGQVMRRALDIRAMFKGQSLRRMFHDSPEKASLAVVILAATAMLFVFSVYTALSYYYHPFVIRYPDEIANYLRRALFYTNEYRDDKLALKYYKLALEACPKYGLDPFSNDVMGIKIQMAAWLEKIGHVKSAANALSMVLADNKKWLDLCKTAPQNLPRAPVPGIVIGEGELQRTITKEEFDQWLWSSRNRILAKSCAISTKLGELYADDHVMEIGKSHESLMWAVETSLSEFRRRATEGVKEGEGEWMTPEEIGGALESLAHSYERKKQFDLVLPLFFHALRLCKDQCHMAVIMNNLAVTFAQHPPHAPYETLAGIVPGEEGPSDTTTADQPWTRKELIESARRWAKNALSHAKEPQGESRTPECDQACAAALLNLGDIAALSGNHTEARRRYEQGIKVSEQNDYADGVKQGQDGLAKLAQ